MGAPLSVDVLVIGGGPAGSTLAARLAQLGHDVALLERSAFPRPRLGESLTPGVLPLLALTGAAARVVAAPLIAAERVLVDWEGPTRERRHDDVHALLVDRGCFDLLLLDHARSLGVRVLQPATLTERRHDGARWRARAGRERIDARVLADATGRGRGLPARRDPTGPRTVCLYGYWRGSGRAVLPRIQALDDAWCWRVPLPNGLLNQLVFVDPLRVRSESNAAACYRELLGRSALADDEPGAQLVDRVRAANATPYLDRDAVTETTIKVGDAGMALDPISSSGVQRAVRTALAGAVVVNTLLRRPRAGELACHFYRQTLVRASEHHRRWTAEYYAAAAATRSTDFWLRRAAPLGEDPATTPPASPVLDLETRFEISPRAAIVELPCLAGEFVELRAALSHPGLEDAVAFIGDWELVPLLQRIGRGTTGRELLDAWASVLPQTAAVAIGNWLVRNEILVPA
jgi:flavin-dependent dehydrogenase